MMVRLRISQSVSLSWHSGNPLLQMRVTSSLSVVPSSAPNDAVRVSNRATEVPASGPGNYREY
jgi:hypothetical protein